MSWSEKLELARSTKRIIGTSNDIEKPYLRLTNAPDPATVRPEHVLHLTLKHLLQVASKEEEKERAAAAAAAAAAAGGAAGGGGTPPYNPSKYSSSSSAAGAAGAAGGAVAAGGGGERQRIWLYLDEQFRSLRQDLTVQHIQNIFSCKVYEHNARLALQFGDLGQFNQCQAQLKYLYAKVPLPIPHTPKVEFLCYRLVYLALQGMRLELLRLYRQFIPLFFLSSSF
ncbi:SAC3/GANP domain-containing protein, putative [Eimeria maxima]|uniref:SAC3/GANP domain-containing protein, putative n=1 Tax=Eimeria maxima TaxID=5804 RepID=U6MB47_EIMMA|nr:SAC3/GANP domain-containing protein, putative [Eimeria maxima]CDJ58890.1 SAC3/GANP domain-containing protein, putative [Eimeria maxima]